MTNTIPNKKYYYVSIIDGNRKCLASGPYKTHDEALNAVDATKIIAYDKDGRAAFWSFGTAGSDDIHKTVLGVVKYAQ